MQEEFRDVRQEFFQFRDLFEQYQTENNIIDHNPLTSMLKLLLGIFLFVITATFLLQCFQNMQGAHSILRKIFRNLNKMGFVWGLLFYSFLGLYVILGTYFSIFTYKRNYSGKTTYQRVELNQTWMDTFFENNNIVLMCSVGFVVFMVAALNRELLLTFLYPYFVQILTTARIQRIFYSWKLQEILFISFFTISLFNSLVVKTGSNLLTQEVLKKQQEFYEEKEKLNEQQVRASYKN